MTCTSYTTVTELPGSGATEEQLSMLYARYRVAADLAEGRDVLEVACGPGIGLGYLAKKARKVVGGDYDPELVEMARAYYGQRIEIHPMDAQHLPFESNTFDVVLLLEAIYYLPQPKKFLAEARRVLRNHGTLLICSANKEWPGFNPSPFSHTYHSANQLQRLLNRAGFVAEVFVAFPVSRDGAKNHILSMIRRIAVRLRLIPKTMRGKGILKRFLYGKLYPLPEELDEQYGVHPPLIPINRHRPVSEFKVIYVIGQVADHKT